MNIGWLVLSRMRTAVRRLCGQPSGDPIGVFDQSCARVSAPISPPPARKSAFRGRLKSSITLGGPPAVQTAAGTYPPVASGANVGAFRLVPFYFDQAGTKRGVLRVPTSSGPPL